MDPEDLKYHKKHTWVRVSGSKAIIGITSYAQEALGDIVYIDLPELESTVEANTELTEIESTKTTSPVISPIGGTVIEVNEELSDAPEIINEDPYGKGWVAVLEIEDDTEFDELMDASEYDRYLEEETKLK